jgi:hypothetical protein
MLSKGISVTYQRSGGQFDHVDMLFARAGRLVALVISE